MVSPFFKDNVRHLFLNYWDMLAIILAVISVAANIPIFRAFLGSTLVLFFPGYSLYASLLGRRQNLLEKFTFSMILSIPISCTVGFLVGLLSFSVLPITLTLSILSLFGIIFAKLNKTGQEINEEFVFSWTSKILLALFISILLLLVGIPHLLIGTPSDSGYTFQAPWYRRDVFWHISLSEEILSGIPPGNPYFAGASFVVYTWFYHLQFAVTSLVSDIPILQLFRILPTIHTLLFALSCFFFVLRGFHNEKIALSAVFFCTLSNELGWVRFIRDLIFNSSSNDPIALIVLNRGYFGGHWHGNVFPLIEYFFTPQPQSVGFVLMIAVLYFLQISLKYRDIRYVGITGFLLGNTALTHGLTFIAICTIMGGLFIAKILLERPTEKSQLFPFFAILIIAGISFVIGSVILLPLTVLSPSIILQPFQIYTWVSVIHIPRIIGIMGFFTLIGFFISFKKRKDFDILLFVWIISIFIAANLFFIQDPYGQGWDILRFIDFMLVPMGILAGKGFVVFIQEIQSRLTLLNPSPNITKSTIGVVIITLLALSSILTGLMSVYYSTPDFYVSHDEINAMQWIQENTENDAIFICNYDFYEIAVFADRQIVFANPRFMSQYKMDVNDRINDVDAFYTTLDQNQIKEIIQKYDIGYVYVGRMENAVYSTNGLEKFDSLKNLFVEVYKQSDIRIYRINDYKDGNIEVQWDGASDSTVIQQFYIGLILYLIGILISVLFLFQRKIQDLIFHFKGKKIL
ncbi:MAG: hypothetical protein ACFFA5_03715 [Promethearchaeota archaeon]